MKEPQAGTSPGTSQAASQVISRNGRPFKLTAAELQNMISIWDGKVTGVIQQLQLGSVAREENVTLSGSFCERLRTEVDKLDISRDLRRVVQARIGGYLRLHANETMPKQVFWTEITARLLNAYTQIGDSKSKPVWWRMWMVVNTLAALVIGTGTSAISVISLFGQHVFNNRAASDSSYEEPTTLVEVLQSMTVWQNIFTLMLATGAVSGIMWLNISGCEGLRQDLANWQAKPIEVAKKVLRLTLAGFAGTAMETLARKFNWPLALGLDQVKYNGVYWALGALTWAGVGAWISGVLTNHLYSNAHYILPASFYGAEDKKMALICDRFTELAKLELHGKEIGIMRSIFLESLDLIPLDAEGRFSVERELLRNIDTSVVQRRLQEVFNDANRTKIFWQRMQARGLFARGYPVVETYWVSRTGVSLISLSAAAIGVYSLFPLVRDNEFPENKTAGIVLGSGMLITNAWIWTYSLYDFIMNSLNPRAYFADTFRDSSKKDIALRTIGSGLAFCFGLMMGLIPLLENKSDTVGEKILTGMEFGFGVGINILISMIGIGAVWQYFMGWIKPVMRDMVYGDINALKQAFFALPPSHKQDILQGLKDVLEQSSMPPSPSSTEAGTSASAAAAVVPTTTQAETRVTVPQIVYSEGNLGGQILSFFKPATSSPSCAEAGTSASAAAAVPSTSTQAETRITILQRVYGARNLGGQILSFFKPITSFFSRRFLSGKQQVTERTSLVTDVESQAQTYSSRESATLFNHKGKGRITTSSHLPMAHATIQPPHIGSSRDDVDLTFSESDTGSQTEAELLRQARLERIIRRKEIKINREPNLKTFYIYLCQKLQSLAIGNMAVVSGKVTPSKGRTGKLATGVEFTGDLLHAILPEVGKIIEVSLKWAVAKPLEAADEKRQENTAEKIARLFGLLQTMPNLIAEIAIKLTNCYAPQLRKLATTEESGWVINVKEKSLKRKLMQPTQKFAEFCFMLMLSGLESGLINERLPLIDQLVRIVMLRPVTHGLPELYAKLQIDKVKTIDGQEWRLDEICTKCGVKLTNGALYTSDVTEVDKYGYCLAAKEIASARGLTLSGCDMPSLSEQRKTRLEARAGTSASAAAVAATEGVPVRAVPGGSDADIDTDSDSDRPSTPLLVRK